jgi:cytochrome c peroxidase
LIDAPVVDNPQVGMSVDLDLLTQYLTTLRAPQNPYQFAPEIVERGRQVFDEQGCAACHVGPAGTDLQRHDVGTGEGADERNGAAFDTPSLRWLWMSAPYFHDGAAQTLPEVFERPGTHQLIFNVTPEDIDALATYLTTLPD